MWRVFIFCCLLSWASSQSTAVSQCTQMNGPLPINTEIVGCVTPPCVLHQLSDVVINIVFRAPRTIHSMTTQARAYLFLNIPIPYDLQEDSVTCNFLTNSYCPIIENEVVQYTLRMYIQPLFPVGVAPTLEFFVQDLAVGSGSIFCIRVPIRVAEPLQGNLTKKNATFSDLHYKSQR